MRQPEHKSRYRRQRRVVAMVALTLLVASPAANAFRCGNKLVKRGMFEAQVLAICGEPVSTRELGFIVRHYDPRDRRPGLVYYRDAFGYGARSDLLVTEMLFNLGPHKLMRLVRFEGGQVAKITTAGYGFRAAD